MKTITTAQVRTEIEQVLENVTVQKQSLVIEDAGLPRALLIPIDDTAAAADLKQSEALLRQAAEMANLGYWVWDEIADRCIYCSDTLAEMNDVSVSEYLERFVTMNLLLSAIHPDDRERYETVINEAYEEGRPYDIEFQDRTADGNYRYLRERGEPVFNAEGVHIHTIGTLQDVNEYKKIEISLQRARAELEQRVEERTAELSASNKALRREIAERRQAEQALKESEGRFRSVADNSLAGVTLKDREGRYELVNPRFEAWYGVRAQDMLGHTVHDIFPKNRADRFAAWDRTVMQTGKGKVSDAEVEFADGSKHIIRVSKVPFFDVDDRPAGICTIHLDLTKQRLAEEKLRQAQKLEAIGQLTGGVAHDFNNLLAVIIGNIELAASRLDPDDKALQAAIRAASQGAELTRQLLAYSRTQPLQPTAIDLEDVAGHMSRLLRRTLGKEIEIETLTQPGLWPALADPGQVETALLNLAINARDAMPKGGKLAIEMKNVHFDDSVNLDGDVGLPEDERLHGDFVVVAVSDTGTGMNPDVLERAFEPFFTTKDVGEGSGMGLPMVYGFARQSGGQVSLESEPCRGTTLRLYLPRSTETAVSQPTAGDEEPRAQGETVLLVEDDESVLDMALTLLESLGYGVVFAQDAKTALARLTEGRKIDLMLSDVMLPGGMTGPELARAASAQQPDLKVLFMSGYPSTAIPHSDLFGKGPGLLCKPFLRSELAHMLRALLDTAEITAS